LVCRLVSTVSLLFTASISEVFISVATGMGAMMLLMLGIALYLSEQVFQGDTDNRYLDMQRRLLKRVLIIIIPAAILAAGGAMLMHGLKEILDTWFDWSPAFLFQGNIEEPTRGWRIARVVLYIACGMGLAVIIIRLAGMILNHRRELSPGFKHGGQGYRMSTGESHRQLSADNDWEGERREIIAAYLHLRNWLAKHGLDLRISATPMEYATYVSRRVPETETNLYELTSLFLAARYSDVAPITHAAQTARELCHAINRTCRRHLK